MLKFLISFSTILFLFTTNVNAQNLLLKGEVRDSLTNEPLAFSYVTLNGFALGTVTNADGEFVFNLPSQHKDKSIIFSYLGYQRKELTIANLQQMSSILIRLKPIENKIEAVIITPKKEISAKQLLKKVVQNIERNYSNDTVFLDTYYRETISENGAFMKYADASVEVYYNPYQEKDYKSKELFSRAAGTVTSLSTFNVYGGNRLHRIHFGHRTLNIDQAKVIDSRSSDNLTKTDMNANIEGGPLGLLGRDRVKYRASFLGNKKFKKFDYELGEVQLPGLGWVYVLSFQTKITKQEMEETPDKRRKRWRKAQRNKLLKGKIYVDQEDFAILKYGCHVPNELKEYFCGYKTMAIKHFDYKLDVEYQKIGDKYHLKRLRHEDEFIYTDTNTNTTTPYNSVSEMWINKVIIDSVKPFKSSETFANIDPNQLFDLPLDYDSLFWVNYTNQHRVAVIPDSIRANMEDKKSLERQFRDKHIRDENMLAPIAKIKTKKIELHGETIIDNYAWLKQPKRPLANPEIKEYLEAENAYSENYFIPLRKNQRAIFAELSGRVDKEDESLPYEKDGFLYTTKYIEEGEYPIYLRKKIGSSKQEVLLDVNELAKNKEYYSAGGIEVSPNTNTMAYFENTTGSDKYILRFKDLKTGSLLSDSLKDVGNIVWLNDDAFLYTKQQEKTNRTYQIKLHSMGTPQKMDSLVYEEKDRLFSIGIGKSKSKKFIYLSCGSTNSSEIHFMPVDKPEQGFKVIEPRSEKHSYGVSDYKGEFYISTNSRSVDYEVMKCSISEYQKENWKPFLKPSKGAYLTSFTIFDKYFVIGESLDMQDRLRVINRVTDKEHYVKIKENLATASVGYNPKYDSDTLRFIFQSMKTPARVIDYNMETKEDRIVKSQEVKNYYRSSWVKQKRVWATAKDGTKIPITLLYRKSSINKNNPYRRMYLTAYGSYGSDNTPGFNHSIYTLINRGFVYAIAHVRGGGELGEKWHEDGKMMKKMNTFTDFIDCAEFLIEEDYAIKGNIVAEGGSAGGLLMGSIINMRPDLFKLVFLNVPFVDVINTMLDDKLPLTTLEYEEWGNPNYKKHYKYIKKYSPYENVTAQDYPHLFFSTGINDTRVGYWEPAKMVAKLRQYNTSDKLILLKTDLNAGHGGGSGRYAYYKDLSYKYAVMFDIFAKDIKAEADAKLNGD